MELAIKYCSKCQIELNNETHKVKANKHWCDSCRRAWRTENYRKNKELQDSKNKKWRLANPEKVKASRNKHRLSKEESRLKYKNDVLYRLAKLIRNRTNSATKASSLEKKYKFIQYIGCTMERLREHLEQQFLPGMSWENHGLHGWHIDHIIPLSSAETEEELLKLSHFSNLQPLWAKDNLTKWAKKVCPSLEFPGQGT